MRLWDATNEFETFPPAAVKRPTLRRGAGVAAAVWRVAGLLPRLWHVVRAEQRRHEAKRGRPQIVR